jgi:hypothetical protein
MGNMFNQSFDNVKLPAGLTRLHMGNMFNQSFASSADAASAAAYAAAYAVAASAAYVGFNQSVKLPTGLTIR